jgi:Flp pilus assembly protein TadD
VILERAAELTPEDPRAMGAKAVALIRSGKTDEGAKLLERALEGEPTEPLYYYEMGLASQSRGSIEESSRYFRRGLELVIKRPPALE